MPNESALARAEKIVAAVKELLGRPALLSTENEQDYFKLMTALAQGFPVHDAFDQIQLNDMTYAEWRKNFMRKQQTVTIDQGRRRHDEAQARRQKREAERKHDEAENMATIEVVKAMDPKLQRQVQLHMADDTGVADVDELLDLHEKELEHAEKLKSDVLYYGALDHLVSVETSRRNECAEWLTNRARSREVSTNGAAIKKFASGQGENTSEPVPPLQPAQQEAK
jgi:hypothetical protein